MAVDDPPVDARSSARPRQRGTRHPTGTQTARRYHRWRSNWRWRCVLLPALPSAFILDEEVAEGRPKGVFLWPLRLLCRLLTLLQLLLLFRNTASWADRLRRSLGR